MTNREILANSTPLLDVRAPREFAAGAFPAATNLPLLTDSERHQVGLTYRSKGKDAAIAIGHELVGGAVKGTRLDAWMTYLTANPDAQVCCARGGLRSEITSRWLAEAGRETPRVEGGFKALRHEAKLAFEAAAASPDWLILGGSTGSAKTQLLAECVGTLDLEAAANHRGSSFGAYASPQPSQVTFENRIASRLLAHQHPALLVEDEGRNLGRLAVPEPLVGRMRMSPVVVLEVPFEERVANIARDYVSEADAEASSSLESRYRAALGRLRKRLGDARWRQLDSTIERAFASGELAAHREWIAGVLNFYYDPMYRFQLEKKKERIAFRGTIDEVRAYLCDRGFMASPVTGAKVTTAAADGS